ncbi:MAG TPA: hypothetical protein VF527_17895 [Pyrinomonadaceae bacterium]|jgi:hypothetical protein
MKRCPTSREELATHEAGHLVVIAMTSDFEPGEFIWHRLPRYEIAHVEPVRSTHFDWETPHHRNALIVRHVVVALAGGAAEMCGATREERHSVSIETIHERVGKIDFELAHEWLTLQRYDPDQGTLELEIKRLFLEVSEVLARPAQRDAIDALSQRILERLRAADASGANTLKLPARMLLDGIELDHPPDFALKATLFEKDRATR